MKFNIITLDGGGMRGVITSVWLAEVERLIDVPLHSVIDLVAGTSTGSILAAVIASGSTAASAVDLYRKSGHIIFPSGLRFIADKSKQVLTNGFDNPKYNGVGLEGELKNHFQDAKLSDLKLNAMMVSYDAYSHSSLIFRSWDSTFKDVPVWQATKCSASAPTYFPATPITIGNVSYCAVDGGLVDNNPAGCALADGLKLWSDDQSDMYLASFGTGKNTKPVTVKEGESWGPVKWVFVLFDAFMDGSASAAEFYVDAVMDNHDRIQADLPSTLMDMDDASKCEAMIAFATQYIKDNPAIFQKIADQLMKDRK